MVDIVKGVSKFTNEHSNFITPKGKNPQLSQITRNNKFKSPFLVKKLKITWRNTLLNFSKRTYCQCCNTKTIQNINCKEGLVYCQKCKKIFILNLNIKQKIKERGYRE